MAADEVQEKRSVGRPRRWADDAERMRVKRIDERETAAQLRELLRELRQGGVPGVVQTGRELDRELIRNLRATLNAFWPSSL